MQTNMRDRAPCDERADKLEPKIVEALTAHIRYAAIALRDVLRVAKLHDISARIGEMVGQEKVPFDGLAVFCDANMPKWDESSGADSPSNSARFALLGFADACGNAAKAIYCFRACAMSCVQTRAQVRS